MDKKSSWEDGTAGRLGPIDPAPFIAPPGSSRYPVTRNSYVRCSDGPKNREPDHLSPEGRDDEQEPEDHFDEPDYGNEERKDRDNAEDNDRGRDAEGEERRLHCMEPDRPVFILHEEKEDAGDEPEDICKG